MRTVTAAFAHEAEARAACDALLADGIEPQRVSVLDRSRAQPAASTGGGAKGRGLWANLKDMVAAPDEARADAHQGLKQGGHLLTVSVAEERLEGVIALLSKTGVVEFDPADREAAGASGEREQDGRVPVVEERLTVGSQATDQGGVRLSSLVTEQPVHDRVHLYDYRVRIERRPVDHAAGGSAQDALEALFRERVVEMTETTDEVRFLKDARVREEVVVRKEVRERVEQVDTTLRRTQVDVESLPPTGPDHASGPVPRDQAAWR